MIGKYVDLDNVGTNIGVSPRGKSLGATAKTALSTTTFDEKIG